MPGKIYFREKVSPLPKIFILYWNPIAREEIVRSL